jgi:hypothetical protein
MILVMISPTSEFWKTVSLCLIQCCISIILNSRISYTPIQKGHIKTAMYRRPQDVHVLKLLLPWLDVEKNMKFLPKYILFDIVPVWLYLTV